MVLGFAIGTAVHASQLAHYGWRLRSDVPAWINAYWLILTLLDPLAALLLLRVRDAGLTLAAAIMVSDIAINAYVAFGLGVPFVGPILMLQVLFGGFVLGAAMLLAGRRAA